MTDFRSEQTLGGRLKSLRKQRGIRSTADLAELTDGAVSAWTLQNLESGRKQDLNVSSLLNLAMALKVSPGFLLAPMTLPDRPLDLPGLTDAFDDMTVADFDAWFSGLPEGAAQSTGGEDRNERLELQAFRELVSLAREQRRLKSMLDLQREIGEENESSKQMLGNTQRRLEDAQHHADELSQFLTSAGWVLEDRADIRG